DAKKLLRWAAFLYPVGLDISHTDYHKHSAYIIENVDIAGCSKAEQAQLSLLARAHRKSIPAKLFNDSDESLLYLALLLRLAVIFNRARKKELPANRVLEAKSKKLMVTLPALWLEENPLTLADLELEAGYWDNLDYKLRIKQLSED
ncbi:MAG TPA: exopolyphosphatase, partial [Cellvibrionaceae bacterium]